MQASTYEATISMMNNLGDSDLLLIKEFVSRLSSKKEIRQELYNPYKPLTREEVIEQLAIARQHADEGQIIDAHQASKKVREKYGL